MAEWGDRTEAARARVRASGEALTGQHAGDRHLRLSRRPEVVQVRIPEVVRPRAGWHPALVFVYGFAGLILGGAVVLTQPAASASGTSTNFLDALFTAASAVCVTGLVVVDTGTYWSGFGQAVILLLVQLGGLGFMTSSTLLLLLLGRQASLRERLLLRESMGVGGLGNVRHLARRVALFTLAVEGIGAAFLTLRFLADQEPATAVWWGVFHAVSAFNNAGFDLFGEFRSLTPFRADPTVVLPIAALLMLGGLSYTVFEDLLRRRRFARLTLDSKLILATTAVLVPAGTLGILLTEHANPATLGGMDMGERLLNAFFHGVTPRTAGFNTLDTGAMTENGLLATIALMFIGGASGSTAGGIKAETFSVLLFAIISSLRGAQDVRAFHRRVPTADVLRALSVALLSLALVFAMTFALNTTERAGLVRVAFEVFSAFGTVGLSTGLTPELSSMGRVLVIATMFAGRLGPLTLALALAARQRRTPYAWPEESVKIG